MKKIIILTKDENGNVISHKYPRQLSVSNSSSNPSDAELLDKAMNFIQSLKKCLNDEYSSKASDLLNQYKQLKQ